MIISRNTTAPNVRGSQPPSAILSRLAQKKPTSTTRKPPATSTDTSVDQRQTLRIAVNSSPVVNIMVVETAVP